MHLPHDTVVAVADGRKFVLFRNTDSHGGITLTALPTALLGAGHAGAGARHHDSAANPAHGQDQEDDHAAAIATLLNKQVDEHAIAALVVIAAPRTLGELRKHYSKQVSAVLVGELAKDLAGHSTHDIEQALAA